MKRRLKINGVIMFLATVLLAVFPEVFFKNENFHSKDAIAEVFGVALILLGQLVRISARGFKSENSQNGHTLIQTGPYSMVRNPMYLGIFLIGLGVVLMLFKLWVIFIFIAFFTVRYILLIRSEEKKLKSLFSETYALYCSKVPRRVFPSVKELIFNDIREYLPLKFKWIRKEIGSVIAVLFLVILIESFEDIKNGNIEEYSKELAWLGIIIFLFICLSFYLSRFFENGKGADESKNNF